MSASNWAVCPRCKARRQDELRALDIDIAEAYGSLTIEEFDRKRAERDELAVEQPEETFREDDEIHGAEDGVVKVSYSGGCSDCGLSLHFDHDHPMDVTK